ncbi:stage III sporulation protein AA [Tissierella creatinini]|nr:stage III sporulation protein AA [Tissierella creatinini]TJX69085.1 stage III sporulation protein AA [Soehngenia saccharolytica]
MDKSIFDLVIDNLALEIKKPLLRLPVRVKENTEEIRLRVNSPLMIYSEGKDYYIGSDGDIRNIHEGLIIDSDIILKTFQLVCNYSVYALSEEIKNGYITIKGGHRVGICGKIIYNNGEIESIKNISSLNFRIAREKKGISDNIIHYLIRDGDFLNTMIISPPQCGKTTLLRDIVRNLSNGVKKKGIRGYKIGLIDERSEVAGIFNGIPQKDIGIRTDILDSCQKSEGIMMMIRAMSPEIIAVDEIGSQRDAESISEALRAGIRLIATIHGHSIEDVISRASIKSLFDERVFKRFIIMDNSSGVGTINEILDEDMFINLLEKRKKYVTA